MKRALFAGLIFVASATAQAEDPPRGMPPEVAAVMAKIKAGGHITPEDAKVLRDWQQGVLKASKHPVPAGAITPEGIPARVHITEQYTNQDERYQISLDADVTIYPTIAGTGDFFAHAKDASVFKIEPTNLRNNVGGYAPGKRLQDGGGIGPTGQGSVSFTSPPNFAKGDLTDTAWVGAFFTVGGDDLMMGGKVSAVVTGTRSDVVNQKRVVVPIKGMDDFNKYVAGRVDAPFAGEQAETGNTHNPIAKLSYKALVAAISSGKTQTLTTSEAFSTPDGSKGSSTFAITLHPPTLELDIAAKDEKAYEAWLPWPKVDDAKIFTKPEPLPLRITLRDAANPKASPVGGKIDIRLQTSHLPGVAMNYPAAGKGNTDPDLYFPKELQDHGTIACDADEQHCWTLSNSATQADIVVLARDSGGYGMVTASIEGLAVTSRDPRNNDRGLRVPIDDNHNEIADGWEKLNHIYDQNLAPEWDGESKPLGMATNGDGSSLFDQYRGFVVDDGKGGREYLVRPSPEQKGLFVYLAPVDRELHRQGAELYSKATEIKIYYVHDESRMSTASGDPAPRWLSYNETPHTIGKRYAVRIVDGPTGGDLGVTTSLVEDPSQKASLTPAVVKDVSVSRASTLAYVDSVVKLVDEKKSQMVAAAARASIDLEKISAWAKANRRLLSDRLIVFTTMHELGHATGGRHHQLELFLASPVPQTDEGRKQELVFRDQTASSGSKSCPMRYWQTDENKLEIVRMLSGDWDLTSASDGKPWRFCSLMDAPDAKHADNDWHHMSLTP